MLIVNLISAAPAVRVEAFHQTVFRSQAVMAFKEFQVSSESTSCARVRSQGKGKCRARVMLSACCYIPPL